MNLNPMVHGGNAYPFTEIAEFSFILAQVYY
jgi:hypothetical protein